MYLRWVDLPFFDRTSCTSTPMYYLRGVFWRVVQCSTETSSTATGTAVLVCLAIDSMHSVLCACIT